jgi:hypothetical protein
VILVIFGYFWLFLSTIFAVTPCIKIDCADFRAYTPGGPKLRGRRYEKFVNNFGMHGGIRAHPTGQGAAFLLGK